MKGRRVEVGVSSAHADSLTETRRDEKSLQRFLTKKMPILYNSEDNDEKSHI